ncbi:MAG: SAM-dependent methyltransferase [Ilumatobacter sp.]|nr:SAM-dependent methyltransferase [Ilumatobacter sp.]
MPSAAEPGSSITRLLATRQEALGRPVRFDEFMAEALYGADGFYTTGGRAGRRGDFLTSPEVGPLFGAVIARWIDAEFERQGRPDGFTVVEAGAGPGTLARTVLLAAPHLAGRYVTVETAEAQRTGHPDGVTALADLPAGPVRGVVVANELLDNLPFRLAVFDGGWREAHVMVGRDGALSEVLLPAPAEWGWLPRTAPHGGRVPVQEYAGAWVADACALLAPGGTVLCIDYGTARTAALALEPWRTWLRTYRGHERGAHYLRDAGMQDITTEVCLDQLPEPHSVRTQAQFLQRWGIADLVDEGRQAWEAKAAAPDLAALRGRSRIREAESLLDPDGLGSFLVLEWRV